MELLRAAAEGQYPRVQHLLHMGADVDWRDPEDLTALHHAVLSGFGDVTELLLSRGADVNAPSTTSGLPLCLAVLKDRSHIVRLLLSRFRAAVNLADPEFGTPLHCAAFTGNCELAKALLEHGAASDPADCVVLTKLLEFQSSVTISTPETRSPWSSNYRWTCITPLMIAVLANNTGLADLLLTIDEAKKPSEVTASWEARSLHYFHAAALWGSSEMMTLAIAHSPDLNIRDSGDHTALCLASLAGRSENVRKLLEARAALDFCDSDGITALIACLSGFVGCVQESIEARGNLDLSVEDGVSAREGAGLQDYQSCVRQLIKAGASLHHHSTVGIALSLAGKLGLDQFIEQLINAGASLDVCGVSGMNALMWASQEGHDNCVKQLIEAGASLDLVDFYRFTALAHACSQEECVRQLLDAGALLETHDFSGNTALHRAVCLSSPKCALMMCDRGANVNAQDSSGSTPLHCAAAYQLDCVEILLNHRADPNIADKRGETPLLVVMRHSSHYTATEPQAAIVTAIVETLLRAGADPRARNQDGETALHMAARHDRTQIAKILLDSGAATDVLYKDERLGRTMTPRDYALPGSDMYNLLLAWDEKQVGQPDTVHEIQKTQETQELPAKEQSLTGCNTPVGPIMPIEQVAATLQNTATDNVTAICQETTIGQATQVNRETGLELITEKGKTRRKGWTHRLRKIDGLGYFR